MLSVRSGWALLCALLLGSIAARAQTLTAMPSSMVFNCTIDAGCDNPVRPTITSSPSGLRINVSASASWLIVGPGPGITPTHLTVDVQTRGLAQGTYRATIFVTSGSASATVSVTLNLAGSAALTVTPSELTFRYAIGQARPAAQTVVVNVVGASQLIFSASADTRTGGNWLDVTPSNGTAPGVSLSVTVSPTGLSPGEYNGAIVVRDTTSRQNQGVAVLLIVAAGSALSLSPSTLAFEHQIGATAPAAKTINVTSSGDPLNFTLTTNVTTGSWMNVTVSSNRTPATLTVNVNPTGLAAGSYPGTIRVTGVGATNPEQSVAVTLTVRAAPQPVFVNVRGAGFETGALAPESIVAAFGERLAAATAVGDGRVTSLEGTTVRVRDSAGVERAAGLYLVSPGQVNYVLPVGAVGRATVTIASGSATQSAEIEIAPVAPGLFAVNRDRLAAAHVLRVRETGEQILELVAELDPSGAIVATPIDFGAETDRLFLILYGTGLRLRSDLAGVRLAVGGVTLAPSYAGVQSQFPGMDQVNAELPRSLRGRGAVEVVLTVDGRAANTLTLRFR